MPQSRSEYPKMRDDAQACNWSFSPYFHANGRSQTTFTTLKCNCADRYPCNRAFSAERIGIGRNSTFLGKKCIERFFLLKIQCTTDASRRNGPLLFLSQKVAKVGTVCHHNEKRTHFSASIYCCFEKLMITAYLTHKNALPAHAMLTQSATNVHPVRNQCLLHTVCARAEQITQHFQNMCVWSTLLVYISVLCVSAVYIVCPRIASLCTCSVNCECTSSAECTWLCTFHDHCTL